MIIPIPYGNTNLKIEVDEKYILDVISPKECGSGNSEKILMNAVNHPLGDESLGAFLKDTGRVNVVVNDAARPTRTAAVISIISDLIRDQDTHFVVATGAHRSPDEFELMNIFGNHYDRYKNRITVHDSRDDSTHYYLGRTRYGNEMWLNNETAKEDRILVIGSIEPHYFAGFTGDRKALLPGIAANRTIERNHSLALHANARPLKLDGNPVHEEMIDCASALGRKRIYSIQMIMDKHQNICRAYTGPIIRTLETATDDARHIFSARITRKADIVVTVAQRPFDINLYQTLKSIEHGRLALNEGGILIFVSPCTEGLGPESFARLFENEDAIQNAAKNARSRYSLGDHNAYNLKTLREYGEIWAVTEIAEPNLAVAGICRFDSLQVAVDQAIREKEKIHSLLFLTNGSLTVPEINRY